MAGKRSFSSPHTLMGSLSRVIALSSAISLRQMRKSLTMHIRPAKPNQQKRALQGNPRSAAESDFKMAPSDTECLQQALREYREASWNDVWFDELPFEARHTILRRAQEIKCRRHRLLSILDFRHPIAS
jgi:hypothetical protein